MAAPYIQEGWRQRPSGGALRINRDSYTTVRAASFMHVNDPSLQVSLRLGAAALPQTWKIVSSQARRLHSWVRVQKQPAFSPASLVILMLHLLFRLNLGALNLDTSMPYGNRNPIRLVRITEPVRLVVSAYSADRVPRGNGPRRADIYAIIGRKMLNATTLFC